MEKLINKHEALMLDIYLEWKEDESKLSFEDWLVEEMLNLFDLELWTDANLYRQALAEWTGIPLNEI